VTVSASALKVFLFYFMWTRLSIVLLWWDSKITCTGGRQMWVCNLEKN